MTIFTFSAASNEVISTLTRYPVSGPHKWIDGQEVREGVDFKIEQVDTEVMVQILDSGPRKVWDTKMPFAVPITQPWGFCEKPGHKCTDNYCDENGCVERKRHLAPITQESEEELSRLAIERYPDEKDENGQPEWDEGKLYHRRKGFEEGYAEAINRLTRKP